MKKTMLAAAILATLAAPAFADDGNGNQTGPHKLTISEVVSAGAALKQLNGFKFSGDTLLKMAEMLNQAEKVQKTYSDAYAAMVKQTYGSMETYSTLQLTMQDEAKKVDAGKMAPGDRTVDPKREDFQAQVEKMFAAPASFSIAKIKRAELCLAEAPPACPQANAIPVDVLRALLPVMTDR